MEKGVQDNGKRIPTSETVLIYNEASININLHTSVFEPQIETLPAVLSTLEHFKLSCAAFQLMNRNVGLRLV